jgi:branched-chain amino acid aminotransferase
MREQVLKLSKSIGLIVKEEKISPFDLLKADEIWITNAIHGVMAVSEYRKSNYISALANKMQNEINKKCLEF